MHRIAFTTFAVLRQPYGNPKVEGFENLLPPTLEEAERSPGFIAHPVEDNGQGHLSVFDRQWGAWGKFEVPRFYTGQRTNETLSCASTLSLWENLESVFSFVYHGLHRNALQRRHEWFLKPEWPSYAAWWISASTVPTWRDACHALEYLHDHGSTPAAFTFHHPFAADGTQMRPPGSTKKR
jgi:hypothetical protein